MKNPMSPLRNLFFNGCAAVLLTVIPAAAATANTEADSANKVVREGIGIELEIEPIAAEVSSRDDLREGDTVNVRFRISDTNTQTPLSGVYPAAWMDRRTTGEDSEPKTCQEKVQAFISGSLFAPPELDLNVYYVLALNSDPTISVVDPLFGFGTTKLLDMIFLDSPGEDWVLSEDQMTLFVTLPDTNQLAIASTAQWEVVTNLATGPRPSRLALQADGRYLWVGFDGPLDGISGVSVVDTTTSQVIKTISTGRGHHEIALSSDDRWVFVTNQLDGTLSVIDVATLETVNTVKVGREPVSVAFSEVASAAYVVSRADGAIVAVDAKSQQAVARIDTEIGLQQIRFAPGGQLGFVVNTNADTVQILDVASNRIIQTADVEDGPDQVSFSDHLAYIRHQGSEIVLMIPFEQLGIEGAPVPVIDFPGGQKPFGKGARPSPADGIVQAPGATAVLVANPADKTIYFYKEGMAAPMGNFQNYNRQPRAVLAVDRSLEEREPGSYETTATLRRPGTYDLAFFLDSPRTIHCFEVVIEPNAKIEAERRRLQPIEVQPMIGDRVLERGDRIDLTVGETITLDFKLVDPVTGEPQAGLNDVTVLTYRSPGRNQQRRAARPVGEGLYRLEVEPPEAGVYYAFVESASAGLSFNESIQIILVAQDEASATLPADGAQ